MLLFLTTDAYLTCRLASTPPANGTAVLVIRATPLLIILPKSHSLFPSTNVIS